MSNPTGINQYSKTGGVGNNSNAARKAKYRAPANYGLREVRQLGGGLKSLSANNLNVIAKRGGAIPKGKKLKAGFSHATALKWASKVKPMVYRKK